MNEEQNIYNYIEPEENSTNNNENEKINNNLNQSININDISTKIEQNAKQLNSSYFLTRREKDFHEAEQLFIKLKKEINEILTSNENSDYSKLLEQNSRILSIFSDLNSIMNIFTKNIPWKRDNLNNSNQDIKKLNLSNSEIKVHIEANNAKILNQYHNEYNILDNKIKILGDPSHSNYLIQEKEISKEQIEFFEKEIKNIRRIIEINEVLMNNDIKYPLAKQMIIKRLEVDYENLLESYKLLKLNSDKNKIRVDKNDIQIKELLDLKEKLEKMANELYGITEYLNVKELKQKSEELKNKLNKTKKKNEIIINAIDTGKRKNSRTIKNYEINIYNKEKEIEDLKKQLFEENENLEKMKNENSRLEKPLKEMQKIIKKIKKEKYDKYFKIRKRGEPLFNNHGRIQSQSFDRMMKKFKEKGINYKKYTFNFENDKKRYLNGIGNNNLFSTYERIRLDYSNDKEGKIPEINGRINSFSFLDKVKLLFIVSFSLINLSIDFFNSLISFSLLLI